MTPFFYRILLLTVLPLALGSCASLSQLAGGNPKVIHALADQESLLSPLTGGRQPVAPDITFSRDKFDLSSSQQSRLIKLAEEWKGSQGQWIIAGFASSGGPPDHARSISQRRAEAVRTVLVDAGLDAGSLHATGYGADVPSSASRDVVRIFAAR